MKKLIAAFMLTGFVASHSGNDFWLLPDKFQYEPGEAINICLKTGDNFEGANWNGDTSGINRLDFYFTDIQDDLRAAMGPKEGDSIQLSVFDESTAMVTFCSINSFTRHDPAFFNTRLQDEGLDDAYEYRRKHNETDSTGNEFSQWNVKTIFQVGAELTSTFKQQTDLPIDIVLQQNPYGFADSAKMDVKVFFQNEALKNGLIKIWNRQNDKTIIQEMQTNADGEISFMLHPSGRWMLTCVKMIKNSREGDSLSTAMEWQSYRGSCTWGYD